MAYSNTGEGMHRFVDPADGETYLYAMSFLDDVQRIFAAFDQPDLKAPVTLVGHRAAGVDGRRQRRGSPPTRAGPLGVRPDRAAGHLLLLADRRAVPRAARRARRHPARRSTAGGRWPRTWTPTPTRSSTVTRQCLDRFHQLFDERYPFGKYDQAFVPEFNAGAMENPGLVTFRDDYVFRSAVTDTQRELRATTIAHEMAHMWFGDLVTMRWWDDLWLNESFAEYLGTRVTAEATRFDQAWTTFAMRRKAWGYAADQRPSTHPVAPEEVADADEGLLNFDGISYAKGASVLRQLVAWLGDEAFLAGLNAHFAAHRFGNATLADLLGQPLRRERPGPHRLGRALAAPRPGEHAAGRGQRRRRRPLHRGGRGADRAGGAPGAASAPDRRRPVRGATARCEPGRGGPRPGHRRRADGARPSWPASRRPGLLLPNDGDLTFAKIRLDPASADAVPLVLPGLADPLARALLWGRGAGRGDRRRAPGRRPGRPDRGRAARRDRGDHRGGRAHPEPRRWSTATSTRWPAPPPWPGWPRPAGSCSTARRPAESLQLAAARGWIAATTDADLLTGWLAGRDVPAGLAVDAELRWAVLRRLVVLGAAGEAEIAAEAAADPQRRRRGAGRPLPGRAARPGREAGGVGDHRAGHRAVQPARRRPPPRGSGSLSRPS